MAIQLQRNKDRKRAGAYSMSLTAATGQTGKATKTAVLSETKKGRDMIPAFQICLAQTLSSSAP
jgi:hypothetical protein